MRGRSLPVPLVSSREETLPHNEGENGTPSEVGPRAVRLF